MISEKPDRESCSPRTLWAELTRHSSGSVGGQNQELNYRSLKKYKYVWVLLCPEYPSEAQFKPSGLSGRTSRQWCGRCLLLVRFRAGIQNQNQNRMIQKKNLKLKSREPLDVWPGLRSEWEEKQWYLLRSSIKCQERGSTAFPQRQTERCFASDPTHGRCRSIKL